MLTEVMRPRSSGFTLLELMTVIAIMAIIMGSASVAIVGIRRGAEMRSAVSSLRATIGLARQQAVTKRERVFITFLPPDGQNYVVSNTVRRIGEQTGYYLPRGVKIVEVLCNPPVPPAQWFPLTIRFSPTGGSGSAQSNPPFRIAEVTGSQTNEFTIFSLTGLVRVREL